jgi:putative tryptophan/tyrosine transport system substrate-binding protein
MTGDRIPIGRRSVLLGVTAALATPRAIAAQSSGRRPNVSVYTTDPAYRDAIKGVLQERGWVEGRTISFELYPAEGAEANLAQNLAKTPADVLVVGGPSRIRAAMQATSTIPILAIDLESDPVSSGFVKTLARPGGNVSGIWMDVPEISGKQIQFLREVLPTLSRLGVVWDDRVSQLQFAAVQAASRALGVSLHAGALRLAAEVDPVMKRVLAERPQALLLLTSPVVFRVLPRVAELAREHKLASISPFSVYPSAGGLLAYGPDFPAMWRQLGDYVDRVLKGARIADLPVERPSKFTLVVNVKTAKTLGLTLPQPLVLRADEVIQ